MQTLIVSSARDRDVTGRIQKIIQRGGRRLKKTVNYCRYRWYRLRGREVFGDPTFSEKVFAAFDYSKAIIDFARASSRRNLLLDCPLDKDSVVFDVGGHVGDWAMEIRQRYDAWVHLFEPNARSLRTLQGRFANDPKVRCHPFGLGGEDRTARLTLFGMGSSIYEASPSRKKTPRLAEIRLRDVAQVVDEIGVDVIDLMKINIEGGEYELLSRMLQSDVHRRCKCIRVQFHEWFDDSHRLRREIRQSLSRTHATQWEYPFVWESWRLRAGGGAKAA
jgi:FkbM family methyltransferase